MSLLNAPVGDPAMIPSTATSLKYPQQSVVVSPTGLPMTRQFSTFSGGGVSGADESSVDVMLTGGGIIFKLAPAIKSTWPSMKSYVLNATYSFRVCNSWYCVCKSVSAFRKPRHIPCSCGEYFGAAAKSLSMNMDANGCARA